MSEIADRAYRRDDVRRDGNEDLRDRFLDRQLSGDNGSYIADFNHIAGPSERESIVSPVGTAPTTDFIRPPSVVPQ